MGAVVMTLEKRRFTGRIGSALSSYPIDFEASSGSDFRLRIEAEPLPIKTWFALQDSGKPGSPFEKLVLHGEAPDGASFHSDQVVVYGGRIGDNDSTIDLTALVATVKVRLGETVSTPLLRLWLRGFQSFRYPNVPTALGTLEVSGRADKTDKDEVSGCIALQAKSNTCGPNWVKEADRFLTFMHRGLAFGHGSRLQTPRLDLVVDDRWEATYYHGSGFGPGLPPIHHLNQGPFIEALARRYEATTPFPEMLWTAVGWLQNDASFEGRYLTSMTALETVVEYVIPKTLTTIVPKKDFYDLRDRLLNALDSVTLPNTARDIFHSKIRGLNARSLSQKIEALRDHYKLSNDIFDTDSIVSLIKLRNDIVHTGTSLPDSKLWPKTILVSELLTRIVLHELGYTGPFESYIDNVG